jgi:hypothetical protein
MNTSQIEEFNYSCQPYLEILDKTISQLEKDLSRLKAIREAVVAMSGETLEDSAKASEPELSLLDKIRQGQSL